MYTTVVSSVDFILQSQ